MTDTDRQPPAMLEAAYQAAVSAPSDINEHLALLRELAAKCDHVTEFGMRGGVSTLALLAAQPKELISWDLNPYAVVSQRAADLLSVAGRTYFQPRVGDTRAIAVIEPTDLLFIDTLHTARQLQAELARHADPVRGTVRRYLVFHDTATFGMVGEDGSTPGLRAAIREFQKYVSFPLWQLHTDRQNCNGLVVLEHV